MSSADGDERRSPIEDDEPVKGAPPAPEEFSRGKVCLFFIQPFFLFSLCCLACVCVCMCVCVCGHAYLVTRGNEARVVLCWLAVGGGWCVVVGDVVRVYCTR
jgi:hypothetical protein